MSHPRPPARESDGIALRTYLKLSNHTAPLLKRVLNKRLKQGKEHPSRYTEKLAIPSADRPVGTLVWLHGVGLGEVLALRGLIRSMLMLQPELSFLVTSSTRVSAEVFAKNLPDNTIHQFLPLDCGPIINRFLNHWRPDMSVWAEQDLWPALVCHTDNRSIPLVLLNARMNEKSYHSRARLKRLYRDLYRRFAWISAQDELTAGHMNQLGASATVGGSLKTAAIALQDDVRVREAFTRQLNGRHCWLLASSHPQDETLVLETHRQLIQQQADSLLIVAPRLTDRAADIKAACERLGLRASVRSLNESPHGSQVYIADTFGEMGIWYRVCRAAFIGGSMSEVQGHNPWEAAILGCAVIHGPNTDNFRADYQHLQQHNAATCVNDSSQLLRIVCNPQQITATAENATQLVNTNNKQVDILAGRVLETLREAAAA